MTIVRGRNRRYGCSVPTSRWGHVADRLLMQFHRWGLARSTGPLIARPARWVSWGAFVSMLVLLNPRARGHRAHAMVRIWAWQIWRRATHREILVTLDGGVRLRLPSWSTLAGLVVATGSHEPCEQAFLAHMVRPGDSVIDVGANIGFYTLPLAGLGARVSAFEPASAARNALRINVALNGAEGKVRLFPFALGDHDGEATLTTDLDGANHLTDAARGNGQTEVVQVRTLDGLIKANSEWFEGYDIAVLKIDAEGHDELVLRGAEQLLRLHTPVVIVETWEGGHRIRELLGRLGYAVFSYRPDDRRLVEYPQDWSGQANLIAVPTTGARWDQVSDRLASAQSSMGALPAVQWRPDKVASPSRPLRPGRRRGGETCSTLRGWTA